MYRRLLYVFAMTLVCGLSVVQAQDWDRAVYWDARCRTGWADNDSSIAVRDGCVAAGYKLLNADELKTWMDGHIADKALSVVVLARDNVPNTVVETVDASCTLRKYLDAGGKIVFYADIPFYDIAHTDGTWDNPQTGGQAAILGIGTDLTWDSGNTVKITGAGAAWGLTATWASLRATPASKVSQVLATDDGGNAAAWVKFFVPGDYYRGFVRLWDRGGRPPVEDIIRVAEYKGLAAYAPVPADGTIDVITPIFRWSPSGVAKTQNVYFGTNPEPGAAELKAPPVPPAASMYIQPVLEPGAKYYWRVDAVAADGTVYPGKVWTFTVMPVKATVPNPVDDATFIVDKPTLSWKAGQNEPTHDVYFGKDPNLVAKGDASVFMGNQAENSFAITEALERNTVYYWRIDELDVMGNKFDGDVWSFTTTLPGLGTAKRQLWNNIGGTAVSDLLNDPNFPFDPDQTDEVTEFRTPADFADNYGGRLSAWVHVPVAGDYTFWIASDDASQLFFGTVPGKAKLIASVSGWTGDRSFDWYAEQKSATMKLNAGVYFMEALWKEGGGGDNCSVAWEGPGLPMQVVGGGYLEPSSDLWAVKPSPADGATGVYFAPELKWSAAMSGKAKAHDVYLGESESAVTKANTKSKEYKGRKTETSFKPGDLTLGKTYYWRVDEVGDANEGVFGDGAVWSFKVSDYSLIDDFEAYEFPNVTPKASIGWWKLNGDLKDSSGKGHDGKMMGDGMFEDDPVMGKVLSLPGGDNQYVEIGAVGLSGKMPTTIACWAKADHTNIPDWTLVFGFTGTEAGGGDCGSHFNIDVIGGPGGIGAHAWCWEETIFTDQQSLEWHHYAMTYDGTNIRYYGDGLYKDTDTAKSNAIDLSIRGDRVFIGKRVTAANSFAGNVSDARVYNYALSELEIKSLAGYVPVKVLADAWAGDAIVKAALVTSPAHAGGKSLQLKYNTRIVPCAGAAAVNVPYKDLTRGGANSISLWVQGNPKNYTDWLFVAVADTGGKMFLATYKDMSGLSNGEWSNWVVPLQLFSANGVNTKSAAKVGVGAMAGRPGTGTFYVDDIRLIKK